MKLPTDFIPEKDFEEVIDRLKEEYDMIRSRDPKIVNKLLRGCEEFFEKYDSEEFEWNYYKGTEFQELYNISERIAKSISYNKADLQFLALSLHKNDREQGRCHIKRH